MSIRKSFFISFLVFLLMFAAAAQAQVPENLSVVRSAANNVLQWDAVPGATRYAVFKSSSPVRSFKRAAFSAVPSYTHKKGKLGTFYKVCAMTGKQKGEFSETVAFLPAATGLNIRFADSRFTLTWNAVAYATGYQVETGESADGPRTMLDAHVTGASLDVTATANGPRCYRVRSMFGEHAGAVTESVSVYAPVKSISVVCEEAFATGPTDRLNVQWNASTGASEYQVFRAVLPDGDFELLGTTQETYYPDMRDPVKLYAYRVRPVYGERLGAFSKSATLWSDMPENELPDEEEISPTGIMLLVNKKAQVTTAYVKDSDGRYTVPLRHMICSTGRIYDRTMDGTFSIKSKMGEWYRYPNGVHIRYPSVYRNGYYFHSPLYSAGKKIMTSSVKKLGARQSLGCIRLKVSDAAWVYKYCPVGTTVYICDGQKIPGLLKALKPRNVSIKGF